MQSLGDLWLPALLFRMLPNLSRGSRRRLRGSATSVTSATGILLVFFFFFAIPLATAFKSFICPVHYDRAS